MLSTTFRNKRGKVARDSAGAHLRPKLDGTVAREGCAGAESSERPQGTCDLKMWRCSVCHALCYAVTGSPWSTRLWAPQACSLASPDPRCVCQAPQRQTWSPRATRVPLGLQMPAQQLCTAHPPLACPAPAAHEPGTTQGRTA